jgi:putative SOS response-associated peptidase YedK
VPHYVRLCSGGVKGFAGCGRVWMGAGEKPLFTCGVTTVAANDLVRPLHERMPAILDPADYATWFDWETRLPT